MAPRFRSQVDALVKGTATWTFNNSKQTIGGTYPINTHVENCDDVVHEPDNGPLHVQYYDFAGGRINGKSTNGTEWSNYLIDIAENWNNFSHLNLVDSPDDIAAATMGAARSNPSRPYVDIPANLLELGDCAMLIKHMGDSLLGKIANTNLKWQFGIAPLLSDLNKLLDLKDKINHRVEQLQRLNSRKGYRKTVKVYKGTGSQLNQSWVYQSNFGFFRGTVGIVTTEEVKVHCRWVTSASFFPFQVDHDLVRLARKSLLGWDFTNWSPYWEALPWSWLIDWCSTCGDYFQATRNTVGGTLSSVTVMRHTRTEISGSESNKDGAAQCSGFRVVRHDKRRTLRPIFPTATLAFLTKSQMGIVASLAARTL